MKSVMDAVKRDIRGRIAATPVAHMLHTVRDRELTGRGTFTCGKQKVELAFLSGQIVLAASNDPDLRLGEQLLTEGRITLRDYNESVQVLLETGERQGEILIDLGCVTRNELERAVRRQMQEIVFRLLQWSEGEYLYRWTEPPSDTVMLEQSLYELILRGMRREHRFSKLREALSPWQQKARLNTEIQMAQAQRVRLKEDEASVLQMIDGERSVAQIVEDAPLADLEALQILYGLKWARIIHLDEDQERLGML